MAKKISEQEFLQKFYRNYPEAKIKILNYTAISRECTIQCLICEKIFTKKVARNFITNYSCCGSHQIKQASWLENYYKNSKEYKFIKQVDKDNIIVKHLICGNEFKRTIQGCMDNPESCIYCKTHKKNNMITLNEIQERLDNLFNGTIQILEYNGQLEKGKFKCLKCGLIFDQVFICLIRSLGCPKCDRMKSKGEAIIEKYLIEKDINFNEQVTIEELGLLRFDFAYYDKNNELLGYIEVQGEQHFRPVEVFGGEESFRNQVERDNRKREYCKKNNIPMYELIYEKGKILNLDILPF